jgi:hypothetical protein
MKRGIMVVTEENGNNGWDLLEAVKASYSTISFSQLTFSKE